MSSMIKKIARFCVVFMVITVTSVPGKAQKHLANGERVINGNRLISVNAPVGSQLYHPERNFFERRVTADALMTEPDWKNAQVISPFLNAAGKIDQTSVRVLYDQ